MRQFVPFVPQLESLATLPVPNLSLPSDQSRKPHPLTVVGHPPADQASSTPQNGLVHEPWSGWYFLDEKSAEA
ncbi:hypothetical protein QF038_004122 [Pseudarthrobacter sp. W1I19]|nr:hypothetical protein [Pseudarthrobacter sp. W1I19]